MWVGRAVSPLRGRLAERVRVAGGCRQGATSSFYDVVAIPSNKAEFIEHLAAVNVKVLSHSAVRGVMTASFHLHFRAGLPHSSASSLVRQGL